MDIKLNTENVELRKTFPEFGAGDTINVLLKIREGNKERTQQFQGTVIQRKNVGSNGETFTIRKISDSIAVERIIPIFSPFDIFNFTLEISKLFELGYLNFSIFTKIFLP